MQHIIGESRAYQPSEKRPNGEHVLGPRLVLLPIRAAGARALGAGVLAFGLALMALARSLTPPEAGFGAHQQLGLAPCSFPVLFGLPCPTCGMTTAFAHFAQGHPLASFHAQPAGFFLALSVAAAMLLGLGGMLTGRLRTLNWYRIPPARAAIVTAAVLLFGWMYKAGSVFLAGGW